MDINNNFTISHADYLKLVSEINEANNAYYTVPFYIMSDDEYDIKYDLLYRFEELNPSLIADNTPTKTIGGVYVNDITVRHAKKLYSLNKVYELNELKTWYKLNNLTYADTITENKLDGVNISVSYVNGRFNMAITRGDGLVGIDVSKKVRNIKNIPSHLSKPVNVTFYGEVIMLKSHIPDGITTTPRNYANGKIHNVDSDVDGLMYYVFDVSDKSNFVKQIDILEHVSKLGMDTVPNDVSDIDCDGKVFKVNHIDKQLALGYNNNYPRWAMAIKPKPKSGITKIIDIEWGVGSTGVITPVAILEPVKISGVTISRVTLHNVSEITILNVGIGSNVLIDRRGDVIPKIMKCVNNCTDELEIPTTCPSCGGNVKYNRGQLACINVYCESRIVAQIFKSFSRTGLNINGWGVNTISRVVRYYNMKSALDIINTNVDSVIAATKPNIKAAIKAHHNLTNAKNVDLWRLVYGLNIPFIGKSKSKDLLMYIFKKYGIMSGTDLFKRIIDDCLLRNTTLVLNSIGIKDVERHSKITDWLKSNYDKINDWFEFFKPVCVHDNNVSHNNTVLSNMIFSITGTHTIHRDKIVDIITGNGGGYTKNINTKTTHLIWDGVQNSSKYKTAINKGLTILGLQDVLNIINKT